MICVALFGNTPLLLFLFPVLSSSSESRADDTDPSEFVTENHLPINIAPYKVFFFISNQKVPILFLFFPRKHVVGTH